MTTEIKLVCRECGNNTFYQIKDEGEIGTYDECTQCGSRRAPKSQKDLLRPEE